MIDLRRLRDDEAYRSGALRKGADRALIDELTAASESHRVLQGEVEALRAEQNAASKEIGRAAPDQRQGRIDAAAGLKAALQEKEAVFAELSATLEDLAIQVPNPASPRCPDGGEDDYEVIDTVGGQPAAPRLDHAEFAAAMGWVEMDKASQNMGSRFAYVQREAVLLEFALVQYTMAKLVTHGFVPTITPVLVREDLMIDAGFFPTDRNQVYELPEDGLFLTGTSEVALAGLHRGDLLDATDLPLRYAGFSSCFRREAGTYGKDTRGIFRVHQFDKVEMFSFCGPESSWDELEVIRSIEQELLTELGLPHRVILVAAGDLGAAAALKYDCEVWLPSEGRYRELTSCSNYLDFSARRMRTRAKGAEGTELVHTLNGTACAVGRTLVFLMEHCQQADGSFVVPEVLRPYCGMDVIAAR